MLFTDALFLPFLAATFLLWLPWGARGRKLVLTVASLLFYACWDLRFLLPLGLAWLAVFAVPRRVAAAGSRRVARAWLAGGIGALLGSLFVFKYFNFFLATVRDLTGAGDAGSAGLRLILPVGISFYTFQAISYLVDSSRGRVAPARSVLDAALYVSFFPMLFAGPIEKGERWMPQLAARQPFTVANLRDGLERILLGYVLKIGVADPVAPFCADIFSRVGTAGSGEIATGILLYSLQIFTDFAGYSLIARGSARLFGYEVVQNFEQPYFARSFSEFWRRWHISLSNWIWEYLFNPLMGWWLRRVGRLGLPRVEQEMRLAYPAAVLTTMLLCGLWHGAGWTFVVWGGIHGVFLAFERVAIFGSRPLRKRPRIRGPRDVARAVGAALLVWTLVSLGWVLFRSPSLGEAGEVFARLVLAGGWVVQKKTLFLLVVGWCVTLSVTALEYRRQDEWVFRAPPARWRPALYFAAILYCVLMGGTSGKVPFIYFQF